MCVYVCVYTLTYLPAYVPILTYRYLKFVVIAISTHSIYIRCNIFGESDGALLSQMAATHGQVSGCDLVSIYLSIYLHI